MIKNYDYYNKVWREMVSGIVFKERLDVYREFYEYIDTNKDYQKGVYIGKYNEFDKDEINYIISNIALNKRTTKDMWGKEIQIINENELKGDYFLLRSPNNLFKIKQCKIEEIYSSKVVEGYNFGDCIAVIHNIYSPEKNVRLKYNEKILNTHGIVTFASINKTNTNQEKYYSPSIEQMIKIIQNTEFFLGDGIIDVNSILND